MSDLEGFLDEAESDSDESLANGVTIETNDEPIANGVGEEDNDNSLEFIDDDDNDIEIISEGEEEDTNDAMAVDGEALSNGVVRVEEIIAKHEERQKKAKAHLPSAVVAQPASLSFDLGNLCCYDPVQIDIDLLFKHKKEAPPKPNTSNQPKDLSQTDYEIRKLREKYLYDMTRTNVQSLVNKLYSLPEIRTGPADDPGILVKLPPPLAKLPRAKPLPKPKPMTRWQKYAQRKGIRNDRRNKYEDRLEWDEKTQTWKRRWGYNKANDPMDAPIIEHKSYDWDTTDPWLKLEKEKKKRVAINEENRLKNLQEALGDRVTGTLDLQSALNYSKNRYRKRVGIRASKEADKEKMTKYGHLNVALKVAQHSTGSVGKFDELNKNEPQPDFMKNRKKSVDYMQSNENTKVHQWRHGKDSFAQKEKTKQKEILYNIFGKQQLDAFKVKKAAKHEMYAIQKKRAIKNKKLPKRRGYIK